MFKTIGSLLLFFSLFAIISPPRFLGTNGRKRAAVAALIGCVLLIATEENSKPEPKAVVAAEIGTTTNSQAESSARKLDTPQDNREPPLTTRKSPELSTTDIRQGRVDGKSLEIVTISAINLFREYERNEVATDMRLEGKIVEIHGTVTGINKDFWDKAYVELRTPNEFMSATVRPIASDIEKTARLRKGQLVAFRCQKMHRFMGSPSGSNCVLVD